MIQAALAFGVNDNRKRSSASVHAMRDLMGADRMVSLAIRERHAAANDPAATTLTAAVVGTAAAIDAAI